MDTKTEDIIEIVDEIVDDIGPDRFERDARRLGLTVDELMDRVRTELLAILK